MKRIGALAFVITVGVGALSALAQAPSVDWKVYGGVKLDGNADGTCFYDAKSVGMQSGGLIQVWTKCLLDKEIDDFDETTDIGKKAVANAAHKMVHIYVPPYAAIADNVDYNKTMEITLAEEIADLSYIQPRASIFYELNCSDRMLRELSISVQTSDKKSSSDTPGNWRDVSPEGNAANLLKILCPSQ